MNTETDLFWHLIVKDNDIWKGYAKEISAGSKIQAEDLLHDYYIFLNTKLYNGKLKIHDIMYNDMLNKSFIYKSMHNLFIDILRNDKDTIIDNDLKNILVANNEPYIDMTKIVDDIVNEFYWFDKKLFNLYRKKFHSIRKLSQATNISHVVVWKTINNCIKEIKKKINEK